MTEFETTTAKFTSRQRLLALSAQAGSVVFAVLVALAIDEWWEGRENIALGERGVASIAAEVRSNLEVLERRRAETDTVLAGIDTALAAFARNDTTTSLTINYPVALLSAAAWQTAQITRAVSFVDIERVIRIARVYDMQTFFLRNQERLTDMVADMGSSADKEPDDIIREVGRRYRLVTSFRDEMARAYHCLLIEIDDEPPDPAIPCAEES